MTKVFPLVTITEDQGFTLRMRVVHENGLVYVPGEIQSFDVRIYDTGTGASTSVKADLGKDPEGVLVSLSDWARDDEGFNFVYHFPYNYWDMIGGKTYSMEITLWTLDGDPVRFVNRLRVRNVQSV